MFNVKLESFDAAAKPKIIREVKAMVPNLTLIEVCPLSAYFSRDRSTQPRVSQCSYSRCPVQAKKFVESLPKVLKENLSKEDAEKLKKTFTDLGATVALE